MSKIYIIAASGVAVATTLGTGIETFLATPTSANLAAAVTNETGSGALVFSNGATLSGPTVDNFQVTGSTGYTYIDSLATNPGVVHLPDAAGTFVTTGNLADITGAGTLVSGATGAGFTIALTTSTVTGNLPDARNTVSNSTTTSMLQLAAINGGVAANDDITIQGTSHATRTTSYCNLQPSGGFVGIGVSTPLNVLDVRTGIGAADIIRMQGTATNTYATLGCYNSSGTQVGSFGYGNSAVSTFANSMFFYAAGGVPLILSSNATEFARGTSGGLFQIADATTCGSTLAVTGASTFTGQTTHTAGAVMNAPVRLKVYTVGTLPAGTTGDTAAVSDSLTPTFLVTIVGGGSSYSPVSYNGANWVAI